MRKFTLLVVVLLYGVVAHAYELGTRGHFYDPINHKGLPAFTPVPDWAGGGKDSFVKLAALFGVSTAGSHFMPIGKLL